MLTSASFKLQKLNRSMDLKSDSFKKDSTLFTPRVSAMNSVAKSVKYNNLTFITGEQLCKLRRQPDEPSDNPQFSTSKNNMTGIRKRYDQVNQQKLYLENKIQRLTQERGKYLVLLKELESNKSEGKQKVNSLQSDLEQIKMRLLNKEFQKMSMQQMHNVINHDKVVYDQRKFDMDLHLRNLKVKSNSIKQANIHQVEQDDRTIKVYEKFIQKLNSQNKERQQHINSIEFRVIEKENLNNSSVLRKSQMEAIAENAMCERDPQEKEWLNIFKTHKLLEDLLQSKIEREMNKFSVVESAFKNIKIATGVTDAKTMVKKFLTKEQIYGDLLSKITQNEKQIQVLRKDKQQYLKSIKKTQEELQELQTLKSYDQDLREWVKQTEYYDQKKQRCEFQEMKLKQYLFKQFKRLKTETDSSDDSAYKEKFQANNKDQVKHRFIKHLTSLSNLIDQSEKLEVDADDLQKDGYVSPSEDVANKLFRIKPHVPAKMTSYNDKNLSDDYVHPFEEQEITTANDETQAIDEQRQVLLKSNQKFMKELKSKIQEQKQLIVQALVKNSKEKAAPLPVKKVQQPQE